MAKLTQEFLKELFDYKDGFLYWKVRISIRCIIGKAAGYISKREKGDRRCIGINGKKYLISRIIFLYHKGYLPVNVDHEDQNPLNDKIENLRDASCAQNSFNKSSRKNSSSKYKGVSFFKRDQKWRVQIYINKKNTHVGYYDKETVAALAYNKKAVFYHKEFANLNIININN